MTQLSSGSLLSASECEIVSAAREFLRRSLWVECITQLCVEAHGVAAGSWRTSKMADDDDYQLEPPPLSAWTSATVGMCSYISSGKENCQLFRFRSIRHFHNCRSPRIPCQTSCTTPIDISVLPKNVLETAPVRLNRTRPISSWRPTRLFRRIRHFSPPLIIYR